MVKTQNLTAWNWSYLKSLKSPVRGSHSHTWRHAHDPALPIADAADLLHRGARARLFGVGPAARCDAVMTAAVRVGATRALVHRAAARARRRAGIVTTAAPRGGVRVQRAGAGAAAAARVASVLSARMRLPRIGGGLAAVAATAAINATTATVATTAAGGAEATAAAAGTVEVGGAGASATIVARSDTFHATALSRASLARAEAAGATSSFLLR